MGTGITGLWQANVHSDVFGMSAFWVGVSKIVEQPPHCDLLRQGLPAMEKSVSPLNFFET